LEPYYQIERDPTGEDTLSELDYWCMMRVAVGLKEFECLKEYEKRCLV
jgi:hypothetical protein